MRALRLARGLPEGLCLMTTTEAHENSKRAGSLNRTQLRLAHSCWPRAAANDQGDLRVHRGPAQGPAAIAGRRRSARALTLGSPGLFSAHRLLLLQLLDE